MENGQEAVVGSGQKPVVGNGREVVVGSGWEPTVLSEVVGREEPVRLFEFVARIRGTLFRESRLQIQEGSVDRLLRSVVGCP